MEFVAFPQIPRVAITIGATTPNPGVGEGFLAWSTTVNEFLVWDGAAWRRPPGSAGAASPLTSIIVADATALPTTYTTTDFVLAKASSSGGMFFWNGFQWGLMPPGAFYDPATPEMFGRTATYNLTQPGNANPGPVFQGALQSTEWTVTGTYLGLKTYHDLSAIAVYRAGVWNPNTGVYDTDEGEMDSLFCNAWCEVDGQVKIHCKADPGPVHNGWRAVVSII